MRVARLTVCSLLLSACLMEPMRERPLVSPPRAAVTAHPAGELLLEELLNVHRAFAPIALSDTDYLFLSDATGTSQLARATTRDRLGDAPLTALGDGLRDVKLSPSRTSVVLLEDRGGDENDQLLSLALTKAGEAKPVAITAMPLVKHTSPSFSPDGARMAFTSNARNGRDLDLYVTSVGRGSISAPQPFLELATRCTVADWKASSILLSEARSPLDQQLYVVDEHTRKKVELLPHRGEARTLAARFSEDARTVYALTDQGKELVGLVAVDVSSGAVTPLLAADHEATALDIAPREGGAARVVVVMNNGGHDALVILDVAAAKVSRRLDVALDGVSSGLSIAPGGRTAFVGVTRPDLPGEVRRVDLETGAVESASDGDHGGVDLGALVRAEELSIKSFDDRSIPVFWYARPGKPGVRRPAVVCLHGGPDLQSRPTWAPLVQFLVARGYAVAEPNIRGSSGYGRAYMALDVREKREDALRDVREVGKAIAGRPDVDATRMAIEGQGYGGYLVLAALSRYPEPWAAGVDFSGIADLRAFLEKTASDGRSPRDVEIGSLDRLSPIHHLDAIRAPLLLLHGKRDPRVSFDEALSVMTALKRQNRVARLVAFEDEGSGLSRRRSRLVAWSEVVEFLDRHVKREIVEPER